MKTISVDIPIEIPLLDDPKATAIIDPVDYAIGKTANLGLNDTGKTYAAMWMAEQLMKRGIPIVAISPSPRKPWSYLKIGRPGFKGFPVVVVGKDGDLPISKDTAGAIMLAAMENGINLVFDTKGLNQSEKRKIVCDVVNVLHDENEHYGLRHCFLEEVADMAPQSRIFDKVTYGAVERFVSEGGNSGVGVTVLNPRAEGVNKEVLELCSRMFLFAQAGRNSIKNLTKFFEQLDSSNTNEIIASFAKLDQGVCWFWGRKEAMPALIKFPMKDTEHPNRRDLGPSVTLLEHSVDVSSFVAQMQKALTKKDMYLNHPGVQEKRKTLIEPAPASTPSTNALTAEIAELNETVATLGQTNRELIEERNELITEIEHLQAKLEKVRYMLQDDYDTLRELFDALPVTTTDNGDGTFTHSLNPSKRDPARYEHWTRQLVGYQKDMYRLFIEHGRLSTKRLALLLGRTVNGTFTEYLGQLKRKGLISQEGDEWVIVEL